MADARSEPALAWNGTYENSQVGPKDRSDVQYDNLVLLVVSLARPHGTTIDSGLFIFTENPHISLEHAENDTITGKNELIRQYPCGKSNL